ncbi:MAG: sseB [Verrucomicrobiales bacterium]|nr:sseB [Verrucomicrobiales bacterium]
MNAANDLERAYQLTLRSPAGRPELFRQLLKSALWFLLPFHPEMQGVVRLENGEPIPFEQLKCSDGVFVPIYTSDQRAIESAKRLNAASPPGSRSQKHIIAEMDGLALFKTLAAQNLQVVINPACGTDPLFFPLDAVKKIADGTAQEPFQPAAGERGIVKVVEPADYPTDFVQPLFDYLRTRSEIDAVWLLQQTDAPPDKIVYALGILASGDVEHVENDLGIVGHPVRPKGAEFTVVRLDVKNPAIKNMIAGFPPFYAAPGFVWPSA